MLTEHELYVLDQLDMVIRSFHRLPACHPGEQAEFTLHAHAIQQLIMSRSAVRVHPDVFSYVEGFK